MRVSEQIIEQQIAFLDESTENYETVIGSITGEQPFVLAYLFSDSFRLLTEAEHSYLLYLNLVLWKSIKAVEEKLPRVEEEALGQHEERIWQQMEGSSNQNFRNRLTPFFEQSPEEDLLAFIEDSLVMDSTDEEDFLTKTGRELIFVGTKTVMDSLLPIV